MTCCRVWRAPCCGTVTFAEPPPGLHAGAVCYGPVLNAAAVLAVVLRERAAGASAQLIGMLLGTEVSAGWVDKAAARVIGAARGRPGSTTRCSRRWRPRTCWPLTRRR